MLQRGPVRALSWDWLEAGEQRALRPWRDFVDGWVACPGEGARSAGWGCRRGGRALARILSGFQRCSGQKKGYAC